MHLTKLNDTRMLMMGQCVGCVYACSWMPVSWNVKPGLYAMLAATGVQGGVFRCVATYEIV